jgi:hypothetical protein
MIKHNNIYFYNCKIIFHVIQYIQTLFCEEDNVKFDQQSLILSYNKGKEKGILFGNTNTICINILDIIIKNRSNDHVKIVRQLYYLLQ